MTKFVFKFFLHCRASISQKAGASGSPVSKDGGP